jgi:hypothetical protein
MQELDLKNGELASSVCACAPAQEPTENINSSCTKLHIVRADVMTDAISLAPFDGWLLQDPIESPFRRALCDEYPNSGFSEIRGSQAAARPGYLGGMLEVRLIDDGPSGLCPAWRRYIEELNSGAYRELMSQLTGIDLTGAVTKLRFSRYGAGAFIGRHHDGQFGKLLTQVLYFNSDWSPDWGGEFIALDQQSKFERCLHLIAPTIDQSIVNLSSAKAVHCVNRISDDAHDYRKTLLVEWYCSEKLEENDRVECAIDGADVR